MHRFYDTSIQLRSNFNNFINWNTIILTFLLLELEYLRVTRSYLNTEMAQEVEIIPNGRPWYVLPW